MKRELIVQRKNNKKFFYEIIFYFFRNLLITEYISFDFNVSSFCKYKLLNNNY